MAIALVAGRIGKPMRLALDMEQRPVTLRAALDRGLTATAGLVGCFPPGAARAIEDHCRSPLRAIGIHVETAPREVVSDAPPALGPAPTTGDCMETQTVIRGPRGLCMAVLSCRWGYFLAARMQTRSVAVRVYQIKIDTLVSFRHNLSGE